MNDNLPPLPETEWQLYMPDRPYEPAWVSSQAGFDESQMLEYGKLCRWQAIEDVIALIPGGDSCSPQRLVDEIRNMK